MCIGFFGAFGFSGSLFVGYWLKVIDMLGWLIDSNK